MQYTDAPIYAKIVFEFGDLDNKYGIWDKFMVLTF